MKSREEVIVLFGELYEKGYRYVVRDAGMQCLVCFSLKPKKYRDTESWGYVNPNNPDVMPAYPIQNEDVWEIKWTNRAATLIDAYLT